MILDQPLTEHFGLYELTITNEAGLQDKNRAIDADQIGKLKAVAELLETVRSLLGVPMKINSAYRCPELNALVGSSSRSQHLLCEAADFVPLGMEIEKAFRQMWEEVKENSLPVGQLIFETGERNYGSTSWIHVSLGSPWRDPARCRQVLRMENNKYMFV